MQRNSILPRNNWQRQVENLGFNFHSESADGIYWNESAYYEFTLKEADKIYDATKDLFNLCITAIEYIIQNNLFEKFQISPTVAEQIKLSWNRDDPTLYGRFDFTIGSDGNYKMLEFNADTPTSLFEASVVQWDWKEKQFPNNDQYNNIHPMLLEQFKYIKQRLPVDYGKLFFTCVTKPNEDLVTTQYIMAAANEAGLNVKFVNINDIGFDSNNFTDLDNEIIEHVFKLYPWEWIVDEEFGKHAFSAMKTWVNPVWNMLLSNKAILPILWKIAPDHPNLLAAYFEEDAPHMENFVKKPILSREGSNIDIIATNEIVASTTGIYETSNKIVQETCFLPVFQGKYACIGSWIMGDEPCGIGIRESVSPITDNLSHFIPHIIKD